MNRLLLTLTGLVCLVFTYAQSTSDVDLNLVKKNLTAMNPNFDLGTARYAAMAGAMGALGGDVSAINNNPAAAGVFIKSNIALSLAFEDSQDKAILGNTNQNTNDRFGVSQLGGMAVAPIDHKNWKVFNIGLLYDRKNLSQTNIFSKNDQLHSYTFDADGDDVQEYAFDGYLKDADGVREKITLTMGSNYKNIVYLGANINFHSYRMEYDNQYYGYRASDDETYGFTEWGYPYNEKGSGLSAGFGVIVKPINEIRVGAAIQTPISWNSISTEYNVYLYDENTGKVQSQVDLGIWEEDKANSAGFYNLSAGFVLQKSFALGFDYFHYFNSSAKYTPKSEYVGTNNFLQNYVKAVNEFRVGGEYRFQNFKFRGGYAHSSSPMRNVELTGGYINGENIIENKAIPELLMGAEQVIGAGIGYAFDTFYLDFAYQNRRTQYHTLLFGTHALPGEYPLDVPSFLGKVERNTQHFILSFGVSF